MTWNVARRDTFHLATKSAPKPNKPQPLSFDRATQGRPPSSPFPVFVKLPIELYHSVTSHISNVDLESLALVDRDCQQLARSVQFVDVTLDFNLSSMELLQTLLLELDRADVEEKEGNDTAKKANNRIGPCVRRVKVSEMGPGILPHEVVSYQKAFPVLFQRGVSTYQDIEESYYTALSKILERGLPNLSSLEWGVRGTPSKMETTLDCLRITAGRPSGVGIRHLTLDLGYFSPRMPLLGLDAGCWALETLVLNVDSAEHPVVADWVIEERGCGCFAVDLLRCVSGSLRSLVWKDAGSHQHTFGRVAPTFPKLREVTLEGIRMKDFTVLDACLGSNTRVTSLKVDLDSVTAQRFLNGRGHIASLEKFHWTASGSTPTTAVDEAAAALLPFIIANDQLRSLSGGSPMSSLFIEERLFPMITSSLPSSLTTLSRLTSLHVVWDSTSLPESSLRAIGSLTSLERLWLSAGTQLGWRTDWKIDHEVLSDALKPLRNLKTLVLTRDSYEVRGHPLLDCSIEKYYVNRNLPQTVIFAEYLLDEEIALLNRFFGCTSDGSMPFDQARAFHNKLLKAAWERWHQCRMVDAVQKYYVDTLESLERCFVGQYWVRVERPPVRKCGDEETRVSPEHSLRCGTDEVNGWWQAW
ncbi:hypothetical protein V5O48_010794 [Marasmius crinis-equi]|uniref:F-box domain-containing protein n=1 Tax=Marasmius crinis-equi TaxID=585013 RepID=A0ABR3F7D5_9AGAR